MTEVIDTFPCFGSTCAVVVDAGDDEAAAHDSVAAARRLLLGWHDAFSRFVPTSELSRLNADPRSEVPVSPLMGRLVEAIADAAAQTGGLVDGTLLREIETAGYRGDLGRPLALTLALRLAPRRRPARPSRDAELAADRVRPRERDGAPSARRRARQRRPREGPVRRRDRGDARRPPRVRRRVRRRPPRRRRRPASTAPSPCRARSTAACLHTFALAAGGVATSGIGRRSWLDARHAPAHHLLDPATGRAAFTGVVQATAIAPTALQAEIRAKAAVLSGPADARSWLPDGGVIVADDGSFEVIAPNATTRISSGASRTCAPGPAVRAVSR